MNLLDAVQNRVSMRRVSTKDGVAEWHGPCPSCGTSHSDPAFSDRFSVKVNPNGEDQWFCRNCGNGDTIAFLMQFEGLSFPAACKEVGKELAEMEEYQAPKFKRPAAVDSFAPREIAAPSDPWIEHAEKFVDWSHQQLLALGDDEGSPLAYLSGRGITRETAIKHRLGWNPGEKGKDLYKAREAWGLDTVMTGDKKKKLWLPLGLVIPFYIAGILRRVRIRIPNDRRTPQFDLSYYLVPGSSMDTFIINPAARAFVVIEGELDAILVDQFAGDLTGSMAMGNSTAKPTAAAFALLTNCLHISNALDYDARTSDAGKYENPGGVGWLWWKKHFSQAERWPVPVGKDPGDAFKAGIDLRAWVTAGLPPVLTLPASSHRATVRPLSEVEGQDNSGASVSAASSESESPAAVVTRTAKDGRIFHITDSKTEYARLVAAGEIVFDSAEIKLAGLTGATPEQAACFLTAKQTFPGIRLTEVIAETTPPAAERPQWRGKYAAQQETP